MIGHRTPRHAAFGWAAARLDDLVNWPAARISGWIIAAAAPIAGGRFREAAQIMLNDADHHESPNAGWPEAAMAGALGIALLGPRSYGGVRVQSDFLHREGRRAATPADVKRALRVYVTAALLLAAILASLAVLIRLTG
jgi:adenosylcobinamide-phosphate synthase